MKEIKIRFKDLPESDQARLREIYGPQPETGYAALRISYVRALTPYESWFFGAGNFLSPSFLTQTFYKLRGTLSPIRFNRALREMDVQNDVLRVNYCNMGDRVLAVVVSERKYIEPILYQNLQGRGAEDIDSALRKSAAAALRYPFDVEKGGLLRIFAFHTGMDEYAVLVTAAQIIMDRVDIHALFRMALGMPVEEKTVTAPVLRNMQMEAKMREYWKNLLAPPLRSAPLPWALKDVQPHPYRQRACRSVLSGRLFSGLAAAAKGNRLMLMSILATAWGLLLQMEGHSRDFCFCLIAPNQSEKSEGWRPFHMVPVRQTFDKEETIEDLVKRQFQQILVSKPYACLDWESFDNFLGGEGKPFTHFLDFYDFLSEEKSYSEQPATPDGYLVSQHSWDAQSMKMSLYYRYTGSEVSVTLLYDGDSFPPGTGERVMQSYTLALEQMMDGRGEDCAAFQEKLAERLFAEQKVQESRRNEEKARLMHAVSSIRLLQGADRGTIRIFMEAGTLNTYFEGDRIEGMDHEWLFVAEGKLARTVEDESGWHCLLNIVKEGAWLNENVLLEERKARIAAEVLSERAVILSIPKGVMQNLIAKRPDIWKNVCVYLSSQLETFQRLWVQT